MKDLTFIAGVLFAFSTCFDRDPFPEEIIYPELDEDVSEDASEEADEKEFTETNEQ